MTMNGEMPGALPGENTMAVLYNGMEELQGAVFTLDEKYCITTWSIGAAKKLGYAIEEAVGKNLHDLFRFSNIPSAITSAGSLFSERSVSLLELFSIKLPLGHKGIRASITPVSLADNKAAGYVCTVFNEAVVDDIAQLKKLYEEKVHEQQKVSQLILQAQEKERDQMGRELHDNLGQLLAAFKMLLVHAIKNPPVDISYLEDLTHHIEAALAETRCLSHRMVTPRFAVIKLHEALQNLADNYTNTNRKVIVEYEYPSTHLITQEIKQSLYRIAQEALNNIEKHANASFVRLFLQIKDDQVCLEIEDNGVGFDPNKAANGIGITNMINRASSFDGSVKIISAPGQGCWIAVVIPLLTEPPVNS